ncbi:MAG TPA: hypothetical protein VJU61_21945 [Polyangiaceae bacterium]|nr:hypothetical protein [Polyangiaceae bacterium]
MLRTAGSGVLLAALAALGCAKRLEPASAAPSSSAAIDTAAPSADCGAPALFCDGFEDDPLGQPPSAPWRDETGKSGASVRVDATRAFRGQRSVQVSAPKGAAYRRGYFAIHQSPVFPAAASEMYGRAMIWLDAAPLTPAGQPPVHWTMVQGEGRSADDTFNSLYRYGGQHQGGLGLMANFETTPPVRSDCWQHSASRLPVQRWACIEWHFAVSNNELQFWLDGEEVGDLHVRDRGTGSESGCLATEQLAGQWLAPPAFQSLYLGWERYQESDNDQELWIDEVVVSRARVGCPVELALPARR